MARIDLPAASGTRHNPGRVRRLLASLGRNTSSTASLSTLARDVAGDPPLGVARVEEAARSLLKACAVIDAGERGEPAGKLVITATGYGYRRPDGVSVVPITALGP